MEAEADVAALVRRRVEAVEIERAGTLVLVVVTADVQHNAAGAVAAIVADVGAFASRCSDRVQRPLEALRRRICEARNQAAGSARTDKRAAGRIAEIIRVVDAIDVCVVKVDSIAPIKDIVPQSFDVAVLAASVCGSAGRRSACMVLHGIGLPCVENLATRGASIADDLLAVPIRELDKIQHHDRPVHGEIILPIFGA